ncbi:uncharacterized protein ACWYII_004539 isoform 3-T5 [Salvelinus alpinus]
MQYLRTLRHSGEVTLLGLNWAHFVWFEGAYGSVHNATTYMNFTFPDVIICTEIENPPDGAGTPFKTCRFQHNQHKYSSSPRWALERAT